MPASAAPAAPAAPTAAAVINTYADIAQAAYTDALAAAKDLRHGVGLLLDKPSNETLKIARDAWKFARLTYLQTEAFRFGNPIVDEWEPRVNSWPLDEGLIDYVAPAYGTTSDKNPLYTLNVIANKRIRIGAKEIDASRITKALLRQLQEAAGVESNVATGYHAIEFLLWGQDLHGTGPGAGERPYTDYDLYPCTHGNCDRRAAYLANAVELLIDDLSEMAAAWAPGGKARAALLAKPPEQGLAVILTGMGSLAYGELAGERMKLGLILHDPEEEQDCFSDNTHNANYESAVSIATVWNGFFISRHGARPVEGASLRAYVMARDAAAARRLDDALKATFARLMAIQETAASGRMAYDQMIGPNNPEGNRMVQQAIDALVAEKGAIDGVTAALRLDVRDRNSGDFEHAGSS